MLGVDSLLQDVRFVIRSSLRRPGVTLLALFTLAVGSGASTAIFSVISGVLIEPLPFPRPDQLVIVAETAPKLGFPELACSPPNFRDWEEENRVFASLSAMKLSRFTLSGEGGDPEVIAGAAVSGDFFRTLGVRPVTGRLLDRHDDRPSGESVAVIARSLWRERFGGDPGIVNRRISLDGRPVTVVGVAPPAFDFPRELRIWVPLAVDYLREPRGAHFLHVLGRLRPDVTIQSAQADMSAVAGRLARQFPETNTAHGVALTRLPDLLVRAVRPALIMLEVAVCALLLIACANVTTLLLAGIAARELEISVRAALGAARLRLARQIATEHLTFFAAGGALGLLVAHWLLKLVLALGPDEVPRANTIGLDGRALAYALLVSVATGLVFGLVPALEATRPARQRPLSHGARGAAGSRRHRLIRAVLVFGQVALALVLLVGAALLLRSFAALQAVDPGFKAKGVLTAHISLPKLRYPDERRQAAFFAQALDRIGSLPGVASVASAYPLPLAESNQIVMFRVMGRQAPKTGEEPTAFCSFVSPAYFQVLQIPLLAGREFGSQDALQSPQVAIVNRTMASRIWPGQSAVGQHIAFGNQANSEVQWMEVVGVVGGVRSTDFALSPEMEIYRSEFQDPLRLATLLVRTAGDPQALVAPVRNAIRQLDAGLPLDRVQTLEQVISWSLAQNRLKTALLGVFAALALVLAAAGTYGLVSDSVTRRIPEIGVRMALGASRHQVVRMMALQGMMPVLLGLAAGLVAAVAAGRLLAGQLYEVRPDDPLIFGISALLLAAVALAATWLPARRATLVQPVAALRCE
jgi:putative ABC transport system permease protein